MCKVQECIDAKIITYSDIANFINNQGDVLINKEYLEHLEELTNK